MLKYKGKILNVDDNLIRQHGEYYPSPLQEWRIENYIRQKAKDKDSDIKKIMEKYTDDQIVSFIEDGLETEILFRSTPSENINLSIKNPKLH